MGASRVMLALLREQPIGGATADALHPSDNIVMKMCEVKLQLKDVQPLAPSGGVLAGTCREVNAERVILQVLYYTIIPFIIHLSISCLQRHSDTTHVFPPYSQGHLCSVSHRNARISSIQGLYTSWKILENTGI